MFLISAAAAMAARAPRGTFTPQVFREATSPIVNDRMICLVHREPPNPS
jgi:hypothetical protein